MKKRTLILPSIIAACGILLCPLAAGAATTIDTLNRYAWGPNIGWMDWVADTNNGAVIGDYVCSGFIYSANVGWINLGNGSPTNGIYYQNISTNDFGVNQDGLGDLSGYAWGANIGWITFEQTYGKPKVDLLSGRLSGYAWSANCGWISLSNSAAYVQADSLSPGPMAPNGLPVPWLLAHFGTTNVNTSADPTGKGMTIGQDYIAGTDPNNPDSVFRITSESFRTNNTTLTWDSEPTRIYSILRNTNLLAPTWQDSGLGQIRPSLGSTTTAGFSDTNAATKFYRIQAVLPLR